MKIAIITPGFLPVPAVDGGAVEVLITNLIEDNEKKEKIKFDVYTIESEKLNRFNYKHTNIIQVNVPRYMKFLCKARNGVFKVLKLKKRYEAFNEVLIKNYLKSDYDYILVENTMKIYQDIYLNTSYKNNMIYHMHNDIDGTTKPEYLCEFIGKTAKKVLVVSEYIEKRFRAIYNTEKISVLYNCVDLKKFNKENIINNKNEYNIYKDDIVFMFSGRINSDKGVKELINAFKKISHIDNVKLMIVGSSWFNIKDTDSYLNELKLISKDLKDKIIFTGYIYPCDMPKIYSLASVVVIPSMWEEPFGVVALEAMAMEKPLIVTNSGGLIEVVDESCAIVVDKEENVEQNLYQAMLRLIKDEKLRVSMGKNAYAKILNNTRFNKENYFDNFYEIIKE